MKLKSLIAFAIVGAMASSMSAAPYYLAYKVSGTAKGYKGGTSAALTKDTPAFQRSYLIVEMDSATAISNGAALLLSDKKAKLTKSTDSNIQIVKRTIVKGSNTNAVYLGMAYNVSAPMADDIADTTNFPNAVTGGLAVPFGSSDYFVGDSSKAVDILGKGAKTSGIVTSMAGQYSTASETSAAKAYYSANLRYTLDTKNTQAINTANSGNPPVSLASAVTALENATTKKGWSTL